MRECFNMVTPRPAKLMRLQGLWARGRQLGRSRGARLRPARKRRSPSSRRCSTPSSAAARPCRASPRPCTVRNDRARSVQRLLPPHPRRASRRAGRPAARPDLRGQGRVRHRRPSHRKRQSGVARDPSARDADRFGSRAPACGRRPHGRQDLHRRMAYSLNGENVHYGTPINPRAPGRIPGGSSSGSAVAVAGGLVDFALGTDCGGSVRLPASYCGIFGIRTTHGLVPVDGVVDLAESFDTVGWFAREADHDAAGRRGVAAVDARLRAHAAADCRRRVRFRGCRESPRRWPTAVAKLKATSPDHRHIQVYTGDPPPGREFSASCRATKFGAGTAPGSTHTIRAFGPGIAERFAWTRTIDPAEVERMRPQREGSRCPHG